MWQSDIRIVFLESRRKSFRGHTYPRLYFLSYQSLHFLCLSSVHFMEKIFTDYCENVISRNIKMEFFHTNCINEKNVCGNHRSRHIFFARQIKWYELKVSIMIDIFITTVWTKFKVSPLGFQSSLAPVVINARSKRSLEMKKTFVKMKFSGTLSSCASKPWCCIRRNLIYRVNEKC